jgi:hypothetical protein
MDVLLGVVILAVSVSDASLRRAGGSPAGASS